jgi:hypothetical protein
MLVWPRELVAAPTDGGSTLGGVRRLVYLSGGPFWRLTLDGLIMRGEEAVLAGNALQGALLGGEPIFVRPCDCRQTPLAAGASFGDAPVSAGSPFDDVLGGESAPIVASCAAAALRATSLTITFTGAHRPLLGGENLTINHPNWGQRMYPIAKVTGGTTNAPVVRLGIPLRETVTNGTAVDFNRPGCLMQLAEPMQIESIKPNRLHRGRAVFVELPQKLT